MRWEYLLADQPGLGLQDLPLVLGDPEGGERGEKRGSQYALVCVFILFLACGCDGFHVLTRTSVGKKIKKQAKLPVERQRCLLCFDCGCESHTVVDLRQRTSDYH